MSPAAAARTVRPGAAHAIPSGFSRICEKAALSSTTSTASPGSAAWSPARSVATSVTICCSNTAVATSCMCRRTRSSRCGITPGEIRRACRGWEAPTGARPRPRSGRRCRRSPKNSSCSIRNASRAAAMPLRRTRPGRASSRRRSRSRKPPISSMRSSTSRTTWSSSRRWIVSSSAMSASGRPRSACGLRSRPSRTANRSPCWCRRPCSHNSTSRPLPNGWRPTRFASRC